MPLFAHHRRSNEYTANGPPPNNAPPSSNFEGKGGTTGSIFSRRQRSISPSYPNNNSSQNYTGDVGPTRSSNRRSGGGGFFTRRRSSSDGYGSSVSSVAGRGADDGGHRVLHGNNGKFSNDPTIVAARQKVSDAEEAERQADRALIDARTAVREAKQHVKNLEKEVEEEARLAKLKQAEAKVVSKSARGLGRHG